jgi:hypothetical protein
VLEFFFIEGNIGVCILEKFSGSCSNKYSVHYQDLQISTAMYL